MSTSFIICLHSHLYSSGCQGCMCVYVFFFCCCCCTISSSLSFVLFSLNIYDSVSSFHFFWSFFFVYFLALILVFIFKRYCGQLQTRDDDRDRSIYYALVLWFLLFFLYSGRGYVTKAHPLVEMFGSCSIRFSTALYYPFVNKAQLNAHPLYLLRGDSVFERLSYICYEWCLHGLELHRNQVQKEVPKFQERGI